MSAQKKVIISCSEETENAFDVLKEKFEFFEDLLKRTNCSFEKQEKLLCEDLIGTKNCSENWYIQYNHQYESFLYCSPPFHQTIAEILKYDQ